MDTVLGIIFLLLLLFLYWLPTGIATVMKHKQVGAIAIVNCFLGWTFIGWVVALAWSVMDSNSTKVPR